MIRMTLDPREFFEVTYEEAMRELVEGGWDQADADTKLRAGLQLRAPKSVLLIGDFRSRVMANG